MDIGKKIREIRLGKLMTQSQLAGDEITRNMLSRIENGAALPSLGTVMYLAKRLGVPAGVLLSDDEGEYNFKRSSMIKKIKDSYCEKKYELCLDMCVEGAAENDDEICYIAASCAVRLAEEKLLLGHLYEARALLCDAAAYAEKTLYETGTISAQIQVMLGFLCQISPMLDVELGENNMPRSRAKMLSSASGFCRYINILGKIDDEGCESAVAYIDDEKHQGDKYSALFLMHIESKLKMSRGEYDDARATLLSILDFDGAPLRLLVYLVSLDIEICCRELGDYKGAYEFAGTKISLIESMLSEGVQYET